MINNLQALRAFSALNVVLFHIIHEAARKGQDVALFGFFDGWGANGVDIFFVISGFVITYAQAKNPKSWSGFLVNRAVRIVPLYWILTLALFALFLAVPSAFSRMEAGAAELIASLFFVSQIALREEPILTVGWTLEWEILFYLLFGLSLAFHGRRKSAGLLLGCLAVLVAVFKAYLILEFCFGLLAARIYLADRLSPRLGLAAAAGGAFLLAASLMDEPRLDPLGRVVIWGLPSFLIVLGLVSVSQIKSPILTFLGAASYSIYLVQAFSIPVAYKLSTKFLAALPGDAIALFSLIATAAAGGLAYQFIEKPATQFFRQLTAGRKLQSA